MRRSRSPRSVGVLAHPATADAYLAITLAALERGEPRRAAISLHEGTRRAEANRRTQLSWVAHLGWRCSERPRVSSIKALAVLTSRHRPAGPPPPIVDERLRALEIHLLRLRGYLDEASRVSERRYRRLGDPSVRTGGVALTSDKRTSLAN